MVQQYHIDILQMMENAGRALAVQSKKLLGGNLDGKRVAVIAGKGNNGGGGLASARHAHNWGADAKIILSSPQKDLRQAPAKQLEILESMGLLVSKPSETPDLRDFDLIIDAMLGYGQKGNPTEEIARLVNLANSSGCAILALDIPTGLDPDTGRPNNPCVEADQTLTLAFPKKGLLEDHAKRYVGELFLADISIPRELYQSIELGQGSIFDEDSILRLSDSITSLFP